MVGDILRTLKGGKSLADSLATKADYFPDIYVNMVRAGEASGSLAPIFDRLAEYEKTRDELRGYIVSSMVYPVLLFGGGVLLDLRAAVLRGAAFCQRVYGVEHARAGDDAGDAGPEQLRAGLRIVDDRGRWRDR